MQVGLRPSVFGLRRAALQTAPWPRRLWAGQKRVLEVSLRALLGQGSSTSWNRRMMPRSGLKSRSHARVARPRTLQSHSMFRDATSVLHLPLLGIAALQLAGAAASALSHLVAGSAPGQMLKSMLQPSALLVACDFCKLQPVVNDPIISVRTQTADIAFRRI